VSSLDCLQIRVDLQVQKLSQGFAEINLKQCLEPSRRPFVIKLNRSALILTFNFVNLAAIAHPLAACSLSLILESRLQTMPEKTDPPDRSFLSSFLTK
jgi:hypothetical protein